MRPEQLYSVDGDSDDWNYGDDDDDDSSDDGDSYESHYPLRLRLVGRRADPGHSAQFKDTTDYTHKWVACANCDGAYCTEPTHEGLLPMASHYEQCLGHPLTAGQGDVTNRSPHVCPEACGLPLMGGHNMICANVVTLCA